MAAPNPNTTYMSPSLPVTRPGDAVKPTLLAFHGSGSNGTIHTVQLARLSRHLKEHFDIISLEAPFHSAAGPGVLPFFEGCGPFKRWIPPTEKVTIEGMKNNAASSIMPPEVEELVKSTVTDVRSKGGKVVGLIGFSQGTRVVAGLLKATEIRRHVNAQDKEGSWMDFAFGLSVCDSYPPPLIPSAATALLPEDQSSFRDEKIQSPTLHVLGKQDEWEWAGRLMIDGFYEAADGKTEVLHLDMGHHYPVQPEESEQIRDWIFQAFLKAEAQEKR